MKYLKTYESFSINEATPGNIGAIVGGSHKPTAVTEEEPSEKADEFSCNVMVNPIFKKWGIYNVKVVECYIDKQEKKQGFFKKLFSRNSSITFLLESERLKKNIMMDFELKDEIFERQGPPRSEEYAYGYISKDHQDKFIKWITTESKWKDEIKNSFEDFDKIFIKKSFES